MIFLSLLTIQLFALVGSAADTWPLFTKRTDVLPSKFVKSRSREIVFYNDHVVVKLCRRAYQISQRREKSTSESRSFETSRDRAVSVRPQSCLVNRGLD